jgi:flavorubredoxin
VKHLDLVSGLNPSMIAPSHGPIYNDPGWIIDAYREWTNNEVMNHVVIAYISMHHSTSVIVDFLIDSLTMRGIPVTSFNLTKTDTGELAKALVDAATLIIASPTVLSGPHPVCAYAAILANALRPKTRFAGFITSYGWGGKCIETLKSLVPNLKVSLLDDVAIKGFPNDEDFEKLDQLAESIYNLHQTLEDTKTAENKEN